MFSGLGAEVGVAAGAGLARGEEVVAAAAPDLDPGVWDERSMYYLL